VNAAVTVVFSKPVDAPTVTTGTVQLVANGTPVPGTTAIAAGLNNLVATFTPSAPLAEGGLYRIRVERGVRDPDGDSLAAPLTSPFQAGNAANGPIASVTVLPENVDVLAGTAVLFRTVAHDSAGLLLPGGRRHGPRRTRRRSRCIRSVSPPSGDAARSPSRPRSTVCRAKP
jgi:hypothetical protein